MYNPAIYTGAACHPPTAGRAVLLFRAGERNTDGHGQTRTNKWKGLAACIMLCLAGCGQKDTQLTSFPSAPAPQAPSEGMSNGFFAFVDLAGHPLPGIIPIATREANAFDNPVATGEPSGADGKASLTFPNNEKFYLRGWDPEFHYFVNNFFEALPGGNTTDVMQVTMLPAAALEITVTEKGAPASNQEVQVMLSHPTRGPWWPAKATSDPQGHCRFSTVPPGQYVIALKIANGKTRDLPETLLRPGETANLGTVNLE